MLTLIIFAKLHIQFVTYVYEGVYHESPSIAHVHEFNNFAGSTNLYMLLQNVDRSRAGVQYRDFVIIILLTLHTTGARMLEPLIRRHCPGVRIV